MFNPSDIFSTILNLISCYYPLILCFTWNSLVWFRSLLSHVWPLYIEVTCYTSHQEFWIYVWYFIVCSCWFSVLVLILFCFVIVVLVAWWFLCSLFYFVVFLFNQAKTFFIFQSLKFIFSWLLQLTCFCI